MTRSSMDTMKVLLIKEAKKKENFVLTSCSHSSDDGSDHPLVILRYDLNFVLRVFLYIRQYESAF